MTITVTRVLLSRCKYTKYINVVNTKVSHSTSRFLGSSKSVWGMETGSEAESGHDGAPGWSSGVESGHNGAPGWCLGYVFVILSRRGFI